jgi:hypothetical protein
MHVEENVSHAELVAEQPVLAEMLAVVRGRDGDEVARWSRSGENPADPPELCVGGSHLPEVQPAQDLDIRVGWNPVADADRLRDSRSTRAVGLHRPRPARFDPFGKEGIDLADRVRIVGSTSLTKMNAGRSARRVFAQRATSSTTSYAGTSAPSCSATHC